MEDFRPGAQRFRERSGADRHDHEFLEIDRIVGVDAAIDDVHHRHRQEPRRGAADIAIERQAIGGGRRLGDGERHAEDGVGAEAAFVGCAVERDHGLVDLDLGLGVHAAQGVENLAVDGIDRVAHALAEIAPLVAVAQFDRLVGSRRSAGRHAGAAARAVLEDDVDLDGRIAAAIENFAADNVDNSGHGRSRLNGARRFYRIGRALVMSRQGPTVGPTMAVRRRCRPSPRVPQRAAARIGLRTGGELAIELGQ